MLRNINGVVTIWIAFADRGEIDIASPLSHIFNIPQVVLYFYRSAAGFSKCVN